MEGKVGERILVPKFRTFGVFFWLRLQTQTNVSSSTLTAFIHVPFLWFKLL